ncbi:hypothetical protein [Lacticaseibacillus suihuaensis]
MNDDDLDKMLKQGLQSREPVPPALQAQLMRRLDRASRRGRWLLPALVVAMMVEGSLVLWLGWRLLGPSFVAPQWFWLAAAVVLGSGLGVLALLGGAMRKAEPR